MREETCSKCSFKFPVNSLFEVNGRILCEKCGDCYCTELSQANQPIDAKRKVDPSICGKCNGDAGKGEFEIKAGAPFCPSCIELLYNRKYPAWLVGSLAFLLVLLCVSLVHSRKYFSAARDLYRGERLVKEKKYAEATAKLKPSVDLAPQCDKCVLLYSKAALLSGDPQASAKALDAHANGYFKDGNDPLAHEVKQLWERAGKSIELSQSAGKKYEAKDYAGALVDLKKAKELYPEYGRWDDTITELEIAPAFDAKDYDRFLQLAEERYQRHPETAMYAEAVASALACKYAVSGEDEFKSRALDLMAKAKVIAEKAPNEMDGYKEYAERIQHRLDTREVIDKDEYDRRYRGGKAVTK